MLALSPLQEAALRRFYGDPVFEQRLNIAMLLVAAKQNLQARDAGSASA